MYLDQTTKSLHHSSLCTTQGIVLEPDQVTKNQEQIFHFFFPKTLYITGTVPQCLGLKLCMIIAKCYIYTESKNEEDYFFDAFLSILKNKIQIETGKAKVQVKL